MTPPFNKNSSIGLFYQIGARKSTIIHPFPLSASHPTGRTEIMKSRRLCFRPQNRSTRSKGLAVRLQPCQYKFLNRTSEFLGQLSLGKPHTPVKRPRGDSFRDSLTVCRYNHIFSGVHPCEHLCYHFLRNMLPAICGIHRQKNRASDAPLKTATHQRSFHRILRRSPNLCP